MRHVAKRTATYSALFGCLCALAFILVTKFVEKAKHHFLAVYHANCEVFFIILKCSLIQLGGYNFSKESFLQKHCVRGYISQLSAVYKLTAFSLALQMNHSPLCLQLQQTPSLRRTLSYQTMLVCWDWKKSRESLTCEIMKNNAWRFVYSSTTHD